MSIKLTSEEAQRAGCTKASSEQVQRSKSRGTGIVIDSAQPNYVCYIGPCEPGTGMRTVCYQTEAGCDDCWLEPDTVCTTAAEDSDELPEIPTSKHTDETRAAGPVTNAGPPTYTNYAVYDYMKWIDDRLYGHWSTNMGLACSLSPAYGYILKAQIVKGPEPAGTCGGRTVVRVQNI